MTDTNKSPMMAKDIEEAQKNLHSKIEWLEKRRNPKLLLLLAVTSSLTTLYYGYKYYQAANTGAPIWHFCLALVSSTMSLVLYLFWLLKYKREITGIVGNIELLSKVSNPECLARIAQLSEQYPQIREYLAQIKDTGRDYIINKEYWMLSNSEPHLKAASANKELLSNL